MLYFPLVCILILYMRSDSQIVLLSVPSITGVASAQEGESTDTSSVEPPTDLDLSVKNVGQDVEFQLSTSFDETIRVASQILRMFFTRYVSWCIVFFCFYLVVIIKF